MMALGALALAPESVAAQIPAWVTPAALTVALTGAGAYGYNEMSKKKKNKGGNHGP
jgi:cobalamin biosynthesis protein CobD/CbiB